MPKIVIGGPAYQMKVSAEHCDTITFLALAFAQAGWKLDIWHRHSSILVENRDSMLRGAIKAGADVFISIDADTFIHPASIVSSVIATVKAATRLLYPGNEMGHILYGDSENEYDPLTYAIIAAVRQRDTQYNVTDKSGKHLHMPPTKRLVIPVDAQWGAFAFSIFNCAAYHDWMGSQDPFFHFGYVRDRPDGERWIGEDCYHSLQVVKRGGNIIVDHEIITGHAV